MIKCIIIDDEPLAGKLLAEYAKRSSDLEVLSTFTNPIEALHFLGEQEVDLLFLDIQMPELTGIQLMKITQAKYDIVLTTAYEQYALESYDFEVVDYLLKPISLDRFLLAVEKVKKRRTKMEGSGATPAVRPDYIFVKSGHQTVRIDLSDIVRLESLGNYVAIYTAKGKTLTLETMSHFQNILPDNEFVRVHRSHLVAMSKIDHIERNRIVMGESLIPISDGYKDEFWERVGG
ncbi:MAG: LytTR family DNA-binding domain-containing protein [Bacteroidota bacterium]